MTDLSELETRVTQKWLQAASQRQPNWQTPEWVTDFRDWSAQNTLPADWPQFPREQWASYPAMRTLTLMTCDRLLDLELDDEQWDTLCFLMQYGGKTRLA